MRKGYVEHLKSALAKRTFGMMGQFSFDVHNREVLHAVLTTAAAAAAAPHRHNPGVQTYHSPFPGTRGTWGTDGLER